MKRVNTASSTSQAHIRRMRREANQNAEVANLSQFEVERDINSICEPVFQDYTKRSLEFLKIQFREMTAKIDDLLDSRPKPCICTIQRIEENEQQFLLPLDSFDAIEHLENSMKDQQSRQQMILLLLRIGGINLQKTVYAIMEKLFSYEIGTKFTWTGKSSKGIEKAKFSDLKNIYAAISGAVLGNKDLAGDEKTTVKVQYQVTEWLRHCQQNLKNDTITFFVTEDQGDNLYQLGHKEIKIAKQVIAETFRPTHSIDEHAGTIFNSGGYRLARLRQKLRNEVGQCPASIWRASSGIFQYLCTEHRVAVWVRTVPASADELKGPSVRDDFQKK
ncbi:hypothetical protein OUZ56_003468 [Daphnia magna]|uniref:DUF4806 domain-containing protein n=1 Tax=Daphnia magna TaxID=35525 RepID=A0ABR0A927_9CRUS|nr:hypothetical protein OUZ56_003468 [Daphnia magna]